MIQKVTRMFSLTTLLFVLFVTIPAQSVRSAEQGVLHIEAVVPSLVEIVVSQDKDADLFDLTVKQEMLKVGVVKEWANIRTGYKVILTSQNATIVGSSTPFLKAEASDNPMMLEYDIYYDGEKIEFGESGNVVITDANTLSSVVGVIKDVVISFNGNSTFLAPGYYTDTLTFTIIPK